MSGAALGCVELIGIELIELRADLRADRFDQRRGPELAADVVRIEDQHHDAEDDEREGDQDGDPGNELVALGSADLAQGEHRVREGADEDPDRELTRLVLQDLGDDPR